MSLLASSINKTYRDYIDCAVGIVIKPQFTSAAGDFSLPHNVPTCSVAHPAFY